MMRMPVLLVVGVALAALLAQARAQQREPARDAAPATAPPPAASAGDIDGETMFATACGFCHQSGGRAPGKGPKLAGTTRSNEYLVERIRKGKPGAMPAFGRAFSESQIMAIVGYIRALDE